MKKLFSILLTVAMLLSAVAFPAVVSAAGETVALSFVIEEGPVYPGDTITVDVVAKANETFSTTGANLYFTYDASKLDKVAFENLTEDTAGNVSYVFYNEETPLEITAEGTVLGKMTFTVKETAVGSAAFTFATATNIPVFVVGSGLIPSKAAYTTENASVTFAASSAVPQIKIGDAFQAIPESGATYNDAEKIVVKAADIKGNVTVTLSAEGVEDVNLSNGEEHTITVGGDYTITVVPFGGATKTYTFTFAQYSVDATLAIANPSDDSYADGYAAGDEFTMPVTISGLGEAKASMIKFTVEFDADALEFDGFDAGLCEVSEEDGVYTVIYNKTAAAENALANDAKVADLSFTVKADAAYGTQTVTIEALDLALVTTVVNPNASDIGTAQATATATIVPAEGTAFATVTNNQVDFTNAAYNVAVAPVANAESKVYYSAIALDEMNAESMFATGSALVESNFTVDQTGYYYVVTKIGTLPAVYEIADAVVSKYDGTAPVIADIADAEIWTSTLAEGFTLPVTVTDEGGSDVATLEYKLSDEAAYEESASTSEIVLATGTSAKTIWLKATDVAGNVSAEKVVDIKIDGVAPTAELAVGTQANGAVPFTISVGDDLSGIKSVVVMNGEEVAQDVTTVAEYAYSATKSGTYTVVVTDNAGNETTSNAVEVKITAAVVLPIKVAIASGKTTVENGFTAGEGVDNGTFRYVKIEKLADEAGFTTTYELTTAPEGAELVFDENGFAEISGIAGAYTLTTTTQNDVDTSDKQIAVYNFNIATSQATMKSVDTDAYFSIYDYALLVAKSAGKDVDAGFEGGLLSADVNADMTITAEDAAEVIAALRAVKYVGIYDFAISGAHDDGAALN